MFPLRYFVNLKDKDAWVDEVKRNFKQRKLESMPPSENNEKNK